MPRGELLEIYFVHASHPVMEMVAVRKIYTEGVGEYYICEIPVFPPAILFGGKPTTDRILTLQRLDPSLNGP